MSEETVTSQVEGQLPPASPANSSNDLSGNALDRELIESIPVNLTVELGSANLKLKDLLRLQQGSVVELNKAVGDHLDLKVNGTVIAKGEVVSVGDQLGLSVLEIVSPMERIKTV